MTFKRQITNFLLILFIATYTGLGASLLSFSQPTVPPPKDACGQTCCCAPNPCMCEHADKTTHEAIIELADCHPVKKAIKTFSNSKELLPVQVVAQGVVIHVTAHVPEEKSVKKQVSILEIFRPPVA